MAQDMMHFMDSTHNDELADFLSGFQFSINGFGIWKNQQRAQEMQGFICDYQLAFVARGTLKFSIRDHEYYCTKGTLVLFEPFVVYSTQVMSGEELCCYKIHFNVIPEYRKQEFCQTVLGQGGNVFFPDELPVMEGMFNDVYENMRSKNLGMMAQVEASLRLACLHMLRARWPKGSLPVSCSKPNSAREVEIVNQSIRFIQENIHAPLRVTDVSGSLNISENHLYKCFMDVLDVPPSRYILQYKVRLSVEMMMTSTLSIEEVAEQLGFSSLYHFSKTFKQIMGYSPRNYMNHIYKDTL